jgi:hypothetical protein
MPRSGMGMRTRRIDMNGRQRKRDTLNRVAQAAA